VKLLKLPSDILERKNSLPLSVGTGATSSATTGSATVLSAVPVVTSGVSWLFPSHWSTSSIAARNAQIAHEAASLSSAVCAASGLLITGTSGLTTVTHVVSHGASHGALSCVLAISVVSSS